MPLQTYTAKLRSSFATVSKLWKVPGNHAYDRQTLGSLIQRNARQLLVESIPYNTQYQPKRVIGTKEYAEKNVFRNFEYREIYPDYVSRVTVFPGLFDLLSPHHIADQLSADEERTFVVKATYAVAKIPNGRLLTNNADTVAYVTQDGKLLDDLSLHHVPYGSHRRTSNRFLRRKLFTHPVKYHGTVFSMVFGSHTVWNYSHWFLDALARIHLLQKSGWFNEVDWFVVPSYKQDFQRDTLTLLGIPPEKIIEANPDTHLQADRLIATSHPRKSSYIIPEWTIDFLRNAFLKAYPPNTQYPPYIYISRADAAYRTIINEPGLISDLKTYGFVPVVLSKLPFTEKVKVFAAAQVIIAPTGAGLNNLLFCKPGTRVIEIFPAGFVHTIFYDIATKVDLEYYALVYENDTTADSLLDGVVENITVNIDEVRALLEHLGISRAPAKFGK